VAPALFRRRLWMRTQRYFSIHEQKRSEELVAPQALVPPWAQGRGDGDDDDGSDFGDEPAGTLEKPEWARGREEISHELETRLPADPATMQTYTLLERPGSGARMGTLKGLVRVLHSASDAKRGLPHLEALLSPKLHTVRVYVLQAASLMPSDESGTSDPYLIVRLGAEKKGERRLHVKKVTDVEFFQCFEFRANLPGVADLSVEVWDWNLIDRDELIGATSIDLEQRLFNREWRMLQRKPLEWRSLYTEYSTNPQGQVQLWVDVEAGVPSAPIVDITPPMAQQWELRVVVWRTAYVVAHGLGSGMSDVYATVRLGDGSAQKTDVHWRCSNGCASFNWRCVFSTAIKHRSSPKERLTVQLWDFVKQESVGEVAVPMQRFFRTAFKASTGPALAQAQTYSTRTTGPTGSRCPTRWRWSCARLRAGRQPRVRMGAIRHRTVRSGSPCAGAASPMFRGGCS